MNETNTTNPANVQRAIAAHHRFQELRPQLLPRQFRYIDATEAELLYYIPVADGHLFVIGHADLGSYEWVHCDTQIVHSDCGWGSCDAAMLDALKRLEAHHGSDTSQT